MARNVAMADPGHDESWRLADELLQVARADTAFADLYLKRARELLAPELSVQEYARLEHLDREEGNLRKRVEAAVEERNWPLVRELTGRAADLSRARSTQAEVRPLAARVYGFDEPLVDPFSPGVAALAGVPEQELPALRDAASKRLERLRAADPASAELYDARRRALGELRFTARAAAESAGSGVGTLEDRARAALTRGDLHQLHQLSTELLDSGRREAAPGHRDAGSTGGALVAPVLAIPLPRAVCDRAARLGLVAHRVESIAEEFHARFRPGWRPALPDASGNTVRFSVTVPGDTDEALREALSLLMNRAVLTSAGTRYVPWCVDEDVLVEEFEEQWSGSSPPTSLLLAALGLPRRAGLARSEIEKVLRERGAAVVKDMGLDPLEYRVVCVPPDVYSRLGAKLGWGKQKIWTHFDGYVASNGRKLMALVGGDVRFGGLHDVVAVGADYDSDRLLARFAIVHRRRFAAR